ncbi:hypothetical protein CRENPOLYSF1_850012 [Crenothrix polyspora]|uniref:DUF1579 domain-containing protein n=2 Tax=Crenothrix polyspora TaxID=360316 RepID=A0A1R4HIP2_9GAMM|nr:hypothetical protein CRENPOLYSF1_850012 [Crenothrix polyspora]
MNTGMARLRFMLGEWHVEAHVMDESNQWLSIPLPDETTIVPMLDGACHREEMPVFFDGSVSRLFFSWSYDNYRKLYRMVSCDDSEGLMAVLEGNFTEGTDTVVINDVHTGSAVVDEAGLVVFFRQLASSKTSADSFTDIVSESYDGGQTWLPVFRAVHTRKNDPRL